LIAPGTAAVLEGLNGMSVGTAEWHSGAWHMAVHEGTPSGTNTNDNMWLLENCLVIHCYRSHDHTWRTAAHSFPISVLYTADLTYTVTVL
jgi:hypothetical protein